MDARATYEDGLRLHRAGEHHAAVAVLERLLAEDPGFPNAENLAGFILAFRLGDDPVRRARGIELLERACSRGGRVLTPLSNLSQLDAARALGAVASVLVRDPAWSQAWNLSGWLKGVVGDDLDGGEADLQRAATSYRYGDPQLNLGRLYMKAERWHEARFALVRAVELGCWRDHEAWVRLGDCYQKAQMPRRALAAYRKALGADAQREYAAALEPLITALDAALASAGQALPADASAQLLDELEPDDVKAQRREVLLSLIESDRGEEAFRRHERWPRSDEADLFEAAEAAERLAERATATGQRELARRFWRSALGAYEHYRDGASCGGELTRCEPDIARCKAALDRLVVP